ncbi:MAG: AbiJ-NTD4 domain-containing protein [Desulfomonilaceae bacterium]
MRSPLGVREEMMPKFSQRYGYSPLEHAFQREAVDESLRTKLWNTLKPTIWDHYQRRGLPWVADPEISDRIDQMVRRLWMHFFNKDLDNLPSSFRGGNGSYSILKDYFFKCEWFGVYDFVEAMSLDQGNLLNQKIRELVNAVLEEQNAAYRFVGEEIAEITDQQEIKTIEEALDHPDKPIRTHLEAALRMLSDRESPDYRNSIKESISAVEAACRLVSGDPSATLGDALKKIKNLHPALSGAFKQLYGYTSHESGIRHSLIDEPNITYADAKFMLVACSAFVSYLKLSTNST